jgi:hypothetical protein
MSARVRTDLLAILDAMINVFKRLILMALLIELALTCFASEKLFFADQEVIVA